MSKSKLALLGGEPTVVNPPMKKLFSLETPITTNQRKLIQKTRTANIP